MTDIFPTLIKEEEQWQIARKLCTIQKATTKRVALKREDVISAAQVKEGAEYPVDDSEYSEITVTPKKIGTVIKIPYEWIEDENFELRTAKIRAAIRAIMRAENEFFFEVITNSATTNSQTAGTTGELDYKDIADAIEVIEETDYEATSLIINPDQANDLRKRGQLDANNMLKDERNMEVIITDNQATGTAIVMNNESAMVMVVRRDISRKEVYDGLNDEYIIRVDERVVPVIMRPTLITKITGC